MNSNITACNFKVQNLTITEKGDSHTLVSIVLSITEPIPAALLKLWYWVSVRPVQVNACTILERIIQESEAVVNIRKKHLRDMCNRTGRRKRGISLEYAPISLQKSIANIITIRFFTTKGNQNKKKKGGGDTSIITQ